MYFNALTVNNFGVFNGRHDFDLEPAKILERKRPFVIIRGHNGAGKSTLFQAMSLALHGSLALGTRISRRQYNDFLLAKFHRHPKSTGLFLSETSSVMLSCSFTISGELMRVQIERRWQRRGEAVDDDLVILHNGNLPDIPKEDYQNWLNDLIPPGLNPVIFFDAEQLDTLASPEQYEALLEETIRRLLGLDLVDRLQRDLAYFRQRQGGGRRLESLRKTTLERQAELDKIDAKLAAKMEESANLVSQHDTLRESLDKAERQLAAEGGSYASRRATLQERLRIVEKEIEEYATQLRELAGELLPFALTPVLSKQLENSLHQEKQMQQHQAAESLWQERVASARTKVESDSFWQEVDVTVEARKAVVNKLLQILRENTPVRNTGHQKGLLHHLAQPEQEKLQKWIHLATDLIPARVSQLSKKLRDLKQERRQIHLDLHRAPDDELLAPHYAQIEAVENQIQTVKDEQANLAKEIGIIRYQWEEKERERDVAAQVLQDAQSTDRQLDLADRSQMVLRTYQDALTRQRLQKLGSYLVDNFNAICRKEHLLTEAHVDMETFQVKLIGANGRPLGIGDFSAGERQLYVMALLQALRQVSNRQLPLIIDTPMARLDEIHRERLVSGFLPQVSNQIVLLATDAEIEQGLLKQAVPYTARIYQLNYDSAKQQTLVQMNDAKSASTLISPNGVHTSVIKGTDRVA
jgi:DNA sulfur modification protein DndD